MDYDTHNQSMRLVIENIEKSIIDIINALKVALSSAIFIEYNAEINNIYSFIELFKLQMRYISAMAYNIVILCDYIKSYLKNLTLFVKTKDIDFKFTQYLNMKYYFIELSNNIFMETVNFNYSTKIRNILNILECC